MTRAPWERESGSAPADAERGLAYRAADGSLELWNDYRAGAAILRPGSGTPVPSPEIPGPLAPPGRVEGYGIFTFPYGPISAGVPEAGKFDLRTYGERVLELTPVGGFKSRRLRPSLVGLSVVDAALRVERMAGHLSASHASAFLAAAESATGTEVRESELWVRGLAQELQRVYNHVHVLARVAEAAAQNVGAAQSHALAEEVLRLGGRWFGHRWLFGALLPGGPARRLDAAARAEAQIALHGLADRFAALWELFLESRTFIDRIQTTAPISRELAVRGGAVGPTLRACGVAWDDRLRVPAVPYTDLFVSLPSETGGDALARLLVRAKEVEASFLVLEQLFDRWPPDSPRSVAPAPPVGEDRGLGRVEAPSGDLVWDVTVRSGTVRAADFRSPSQANWPLFAAGMRDAVFTDFHFAYESFGFAFAETDG